MYLHHTNYSLSIILVFIGGKSQIMPLNMYITFPNDDWYQSIPVSVKETGLHVAQKQFPINQCLRTQEQIFDIMFKNGKMRSAHHASGQFHCRLLIIHISTHLTHFVEHGRLFNEVFSELFMFGMDIKIHVA